MTSHDITSTRLLAPQLGADLAVELAERADRGVAQPGVGEEGGLARDGQVEPM